MRPTLLLLSCTLLWVLASGSAHAHPPYGIALDKEERVHLLDWPTARVLRMDDRGKVDVVVDFHALGVKGHPHALAFDGAGRLLVAETYGRRIWIVAADGSVRLHPWAAREDDGRGAVQDLEVGPRGRLHLMRRLALPGGGARYTLERVESGGAVTRLLETPSTAFHLYASCLAVTPDGTVWLSSGNRILRVREDALEVVAGAKEAGHRDGRGAAARFAGCYGIAAAADGSLVVADEGNARIRRVTPDGIVTTIAPEARFEGPYQVTVGPAGTIVVAEAIGRPARHRVRHIEDGRVRVVGTTLVGSPGVPKAPRTLDDFRKISKANAERAPVTELTGLDPLKDWPLSLWVERAHQEAGAKAWDAPLFLNGVTYLEPEEAKALAAYEGSRIFLPDVKALDAVTAEALASTHAELWLDGLETLDFAVARTLGPSKRHRLSLRGVTQITARVAKRLCEVRGSVLLDGVREIEPVPLTVLASWKGYGEQVLLTLGLTELDPERAGILASCTGWGIALDRLTSLSPEAARELGKLGSAYLSLDGLTSISLETARVMAGWERKFLTLNGMVEVAPDVRALVEQGCAAVSWRGLAKTQQPGGR